VLLFLVLFWIVVWALLMLDGMAISRRRKIPEPYVRPTPEEEDELVHGLWAIKDDE
jgi:hypothetical protein